MGRDDIYSVKQMEGRLSQSWDEGMLIPRPVHSFWFWLLLVLQILWTTAWEQQKQHRNCYSFSPSSGYALQEISLPDVFVLDCVAKPGFDMEQKSTADIRMLAGKSSLEINFAWMCINKFPSLKCQIIHRVFKTSI